MAIAVAPEPRTSFPGSGQAAVLKQPLRILLVEDSEDDVALFRHMLANALTEHPVHLARAEASAPALEQLQQGAYDIVFLDYQLGVDTGLDLLRAARQGGLDTPMVFLTGHGDEQLAVEAMKCGACDYLAKSKLDVATLQRTLRFALSLREHQKRLQQAQAELRAREQRFRALVENAFDATVLMNAEGMIQWASNSCPRVLGLEVEQLLGSSGFDLLNGEGAGQARRWWRELLRHPGEPVQVSFQHKNGSVRDIEGAGTNWLGESAVGAVVFNLRDVTERRRWEEKLRKLSSAVEQSADVVVITDREGTIEYVNPAFQKLTGYGPDEVLGRNPRLLK
ncbi:MAG TPA: PAS domain S-box protein, partial [Terriglobales bacterium]|nr:PAS domain S-box protein [Terriglobales bacterium]